MLEISQGCYIGATGMQVPLINGPTAKLLRDKKLRKLRPLLVWIVMLLLVKRVESKNKEQMNNNEK